MASESQIKANRLNAQKSTGPKTAEGKAAVAQNALKHGLFARENVIKCEKVSEFEHFREELLAGLAPVGGVEAMLAERIVSLSWRLKRVERMNSEAIDVMIAKIETDSFERRQRRETGLVDSESGRSELALGWAMIKDFSGSSAVLERPLMYEKRIESSLYKGMNELQKLQRLRKIEQAETMKSEAAQPSRRRCSEPVLSLPKEQAEGLTHRGRDAHETQGRDALATKEATQSGGERLRCEKQSQFIPLQICIYAFVEKRHTTYKLRYTSDDLIRDVEIGVRVLDVIVVLEGLH